LFQINQNPVLQEKLGN